MDILTSKIIEKLNRNKTSNFLDNNQLYEVTSNLNKFKIKYNIYRPYKESDRNIIYKEELPNISILKIITNTVLKHQDILGFLYNFQIDMSLIGDIIITDNYYIICKKEISDYLIYNIDRIKNANVILEEIDISCLENYKREYDEIKLLVSSLRIDAVVSRLTNQSRKDSLESIKNKMVVLNYKEINKVVTLKENDILSIRKYGKYKYIKIDKYTKKNLIILLKKYR